ncbi:MAG TPA: hypothetical protein VK640_07220 [Actinomycetes bacterium]|nr:hypothetical protein [Actinomycetes bacterium]
MPSQHDRLRARPTADAPTVAGPDRGDIVIGWLTKIVVVLGIAGLGLFDAISLGSTAVSLSDQGQYAAREASEVWQQTESVQKAYEAAAESAASQNAQNVVDPESFRIDPDDTVHLQIERTATTIVLRHWGTSAKWAELEREAKGRSVG